MLLTFELERLCREVEANSAAVQSICAGLSDQQLTWRPTANRWSVAEIVSHLNLTTRQCLGPVDRAIAEADRRGLRSVGPFRLTVMGRFFVWYVEPPPKMRLPTPKTLAPQADAPPAQILCDFASLQEQMLQRIRRANGLDLNRARFRSPFAGFVTMDLLAFFSVFTGHERRHIWQARNVVESAPASYGVPVSS